MPQHLAAGFLVGPPWNSNVPESGGKWIRPVQFRLPESTPVKTDAVERAGAYRGKDLHSRVAG